VYIEAEGLETQLWQNGKETGREKGEGQLWQAPSKKSCEASEDGEEHTEPDVDVHIEKPSKVCEPIGTQHLGFSAYKSDGQQNGPIAYK
jgi:hypothetical protein